MRAAKASAKGSKKERVEKTEAGRLVNEELRRRGWTQGRLAEAMKELGAKAAEGLISKYISGKRTPNGVRAGAIQDILGVPPRLWGVPAKKGAA